MPSDRHLSLVHISDHSKKTTDSQYRSYKSVDKTICKMAEPQPFWNLRQPKGNIITAVGSINFFQPPANHFNQSCLPTRAKAKEEGWEEVPDRKGGFPCLPGLVYWRGKCVVSPCPGLTAPITTGQHCTSLHHGFTAKDWKGHICPHDVLFD